jgi:hypothetical protein
VPKRRPLKKRYDCSVYLEAPLGEMVELETQRNKAALLGKIIGATRPIIPHRAEEGSTILHLSLTDADILRLLAAMMDNDLEMLKITKVVIPDSSWLIIILALLNYNNKDLVNQLNLQPLSPQAQPHVIEPESLSELLSGHVLENDMMMKTPNCLICKRID